MGALLAAPAVGGAMAATSLIQGAWVYKKERDRDEQEITHDHMRDARDMHNEQLQTLLLMDTLLFGSAFGVLIEGMPPEGTPVAVLVPFTSILALSLSANVASMYFAMQVVYRVLQFKITRSRDTRWFKRESEFDTKDRARLFDEFYSTYCTPTERLANHLFTISLISILLLGSMLVLIRSFVVYNSPTTAFTFLATVAGCATLLWQHREHGSDSGGDYVVVDKDGFSGGSSRNLRKKRKNRSAIGDSFVLVDAPDPATPLLRPAGGAATAMARAATGSPRNSPRAAGRADRAAAPADPPAEAPDEPPDVPRCDSVGSYVVLSSAEARELAAGTRIRHAAPEEGGGEGEQGEGTVVSFRDGMAVVEWDLTPGRGAVYRYGAGGVFDLVPAGGADDAAATADDFPVGAQVGAVGLLKRTELNGVAGRVCAHDSRAGERLVIVELPEPHGRVALRPHNLVLHPSLSGAGNSTVGSSVDSTVHATPVEGALVPAAAGGAPPAVGRDPAPGAAASTAEESGFHSPSADRASGSRSPLADRAGGGRRSPPDCAGGCGAADRAPGSRSPPAERAGSSSPASPTEGAGSRTASPAECAGGGSGGARGECGLRRRRPRSDPDDGSADVQDAGMERRWATVEAAVASASASAGGQQNSTPPPAEERSVDGDGPS